MRKYNRTMLRLEKTKSIKQNETPSFCSDCGQCCKRLPGGYAPDQFKTTREIRLSLMSGATILEYWIADDGQNIYYLRPKKEAETGLIAPSSYYIDRGHCVNLTLVGCALDWQDRPHGCRTLKATAPKTCESMYDGAPVKKRLAYAWHRSRFRLWELVKEMGL